MSIPLGTVNKAILDVLEVESGIKRKSVCKSLIERNISRVVVYEGGIVYVEVKERRGMKHGQEEQKE